MLCTQLAAKFAWEQKFDKTLSEIHFRKYMRKISAVGLFSCDKFEETPKQKVINMSKLNKFHFKIQQKSLGDESPLNVRKPIPNQLCYYCEI